MKAVRFSAVIKKFSVRQAEEGGQPTMGLLLSMGEPNRKALGALCHRPEEACSALEAAVKAEGKVEIPAGEEVCSLSASAGSKDHECPGVHFLRISLDSRGGETQMRILYEEPKTAGGGSFYLAHIGQSVEFAVAPQQATIDDEVEAKKGRQSAPVGAGKARKGAAAQDGPDAATGKGTAKDAILTEALRAVSPATLADARQFVTQKLDGKGVGITGMARELYGSATADRKVAAEAILISLVGDGLLVSTDNGKGEQIYYAADKK